MWLFIFIASLERLQTFQSISPARANTLRQFETETIGSGERENSLHLLRILCKGEGGPHLATSMSQMTETPPTKYSVYLRHKLQNH